MSTKEYGSFATFWWEWEKKLNPMIKKRQATLQFAPLSGPSTENGKATFELKEPIVISQAPQKSASAKKDRHAIFILGKFVFDRVDGVATPVLVNASTSITIYSVHRKSDDEITAEMFEAVHFDMEDACAQKPFHPIFHAQRGADNRLLPEALTPALARGWRIRNEGVEIKSSQVPGTPYLRLPTPQLDLFSVLTMVIADFFCHLPDSANGKPPENPNVLTEFKGLLTLLMDKRNLAREGQCSAAVMARQNGSGFPSSGHWYAESA